MNKINRNKVEKPDCLKEKLVEWTEHYIKKRKVNKNYWYWQKYNSKKVEHILTPILSELTNFHCSYCGIFPLKQDVGGRSIDHFKPKSKYPNLAFEWTNLFIACPVCQNIKGSKFPEDIEPLKFDNCHYDFDYWFEIDWTIDKNHIIPNKDRSKQEQEKAKETIDWLGLNNGDKPESRFIELQKFNGSNIDINQWSYPFFLERG